jgi:predicted RNase H-like nuclease
MHVRGIDGYTGGWVAVDLLEGRFAGAHVVGPHALRELCDDRVCVIGVDMPIGLVDDAREADSAAREALKPRGASVFPAPPRSAIAATAYEEANRIARETLGRGMSQQTYALISKIRFVDALSCDTRIHEVHPELSFLALAGGVPLSHGKKTWRGQAQRRELLAAVGIVLPSDLGAANEVPPDDVLDAAAAAWSASRIARGEAQSYPPAPSQRDGARVIAIWA